MTSPVQGDRAKTPGIPIKRSLIANFIGQGWTAISGFIFVPFYIQLLGIEAYGVIGFFVVLQASLSLLDLGMTPTITRELARYSGGLSRDVETVQLVRGFTLLSLAVGFVIIMGLLVAAPFLSSGWFGASRLDPGELNIAFQCVAIVVGLRFCEGLLRGALVGLDRQVLLNSLLVIFATLRNGGVLVALLLVGPTLPVFFAYQAILSVLVLVSFGLAVRSSLPHVSVGRLSFAPVRASLGFSAGMLAITASSLVITQADKFILSRLVPLADFSAYMLAVMLGSGLTLLVTPIAQAFYPRLVQFVGEDDQEELQRIYHMASQIAAALVLPAIVLVAFFANAIIVVWTGNRELANTLTIVLPVVVAGTGANALFFIPFHAQLALGWTSMIARYNAGAAFTIVILIAVAAPSYGIVAAAFIWLGLNVSYLLVLIPALHKRFLPGHVARWYRDTMVLPGLATLVVGGVAYLMRPPTGDRIWEAAFLICVYLCLTFAAALASPTLRYRLAATVLSRQR